MKNLLQGGTKRATVLPRISQGSVATHLRCGGIFNDDLVYFVTNLLLQNVENWSEFGELMGNVVALFRCIVARYSCSRLRTVIAERDPTLARSF